MAIFIISNRETTKNKEGKLRFKDARSGRQRASHDFRIAEYDLEDDDYDIKGDLSDDDYEGVANSKSTRLTGTKYMFNKLYKSNLDECVDAGDILFFIHGFNYKFKDNLRDIKKLNDLYLNDKSGVKHLVYVSWPSRGRILKYKDDQLDARETGIVLGRLFGKLRRFFIDTFGPYGENDPCNKKIHLAAHSMGNQVLYKMLSALPQRQKFSVFSEVLLLNADAPYDGFEPEMPFTVLQEIGERTTIYMHKSDDALWISDKTKDNSKRLGRSGPKNTENLNEETFVVDTTKVKGRASKREKFIDHWGYLNRRAVIDDVTAVLSGKAYSEIGKRTRHDDKRNYFSL